MNLLFKKKYFHFRLRKLLSDEEMQFEAEFQLAMNRRIDDDIESRRNHLLSLKIEREEKRKRFVEEKKMQQLMCVYLSIHKGYILITKNIFSERCDAVRPIMQQQLLDESKRVQLVQIEERKALKAINKDFENLWHSVGMKRHEQLVRYWSLSLIPSFILIIFLEFPFKFQRNAKK